MWVGVLSAAAPAFGQAKLSDRPYRGVFGGGHDLAARHTLDFSMQFDEAYDDNVFADSGVQPTPGSQQDSGYYTNLVANGSYAWKGTRAQIAANAASTLRHYEGIQGIRVIGTTAGLGLSALMTSRTRLFVNQSAAYSPSYLFGLFPTVEPPAPGDQPPASADYRTDVSESYSYGTSLSLTHGLSVRNSVSAYLDYTYTDVVRETLSRHDASAYGVRGEFSRNLMRRTAMRLGYRYRRGDVGYGVSQTTRPTVENGLDFGLDYTKVLSASRQALFGFSLGTSAVDLPEGSDLLVHGRLYRAVGGATFGYQFGRSWQARMVYRRGLDYVAELSQPVFSDSVSAAVDGFLTDRWTVTVSGGYSSGESAVLSNSSTFDTYTGTVKIRYAVSRMWAANVDYVYYYYDFRGGLRLPPGVPPTLERNGLRAGLTMWMPAFRK